MAKLAAIKLMFGSEWAAQVKILQEFIDQSRKIPPAATPLIDP